VNTVSCTIYVFLYIAINLRVASLSPTKKEVCLSSALSYDKASTKMGPSVAILKALIQAHTRLKSNVPPGSPIPLMVLPPRLEQGIKLFCSSCRVTAVSKLGTYTRDAK